MRKILLLFVLFVVSFTAKAQLADGSTAPNWTLTDLNGTSWTLYDVLNSGKKVAIDFSATWCGPCWNYHNGGALEGLYDDFGPSGTNELMVFFIEPDVSTNLACLYGPSGCVGGTQGNWVAGTPYPIINTTTSQINNDYDINYYPTLYAINTDKKIYEVGQPSQTGWENWMFQSFEMEVTGTSTNAICPNTGSINLTVTSGYSNKTYEWSNGATTQDLINVNAGDYFVTVTDGNGYSIEKSFTIAGPSEILNVDNAVIDPITCATYNNGSITLNTEGGYPGYSFSWSNGSSNNVVSDLAPGTYSVVVTDNQGCTLGESFVVESPEPITTNAFANNATCGNANGSVTIEAEGGTGSHFFQLGNGNASTQNTFFDIPAGIHEYTVTDLNGCFNTSTFEILSTGSPVAQAAASGNLNCAVNQVTVSGAGSATGAGITYLWTTTNGSIVSGANTINAVVNSAGTYSLKVTNTNLGCSTTTTTQVNYINNAPVANAGTSQVLTCALPQVTLNGAASSSGTEFTYAWSTTNGNIVSGANTATPAVNDPGVYNLVVTNTTTNCSATSQVTITEDVLAPAITVSNGSLTCAVGTAEICATVGTGVNVSWSINGTVINTACTSVSAAGSYTATAQSTNGCTTTAVSTVSSAAGLPQISAQLPANLTCVVTETTITGELVGNVTDYNITWSTANGNIVSGATTLTPTVNKAGLYTMTAVNIATACTSSLGVTVSEVLNTPVAQYSSTLTNGQLTLTNIATATGTVSWNLGNGQSAAGNSTTVSFPASGNYTICMTLTNECGTNTSCNEVAYFTALAVSGIVENAKCAGSNGAIATTITGGPITGALSYNWTGPNGFTATTESISNVPAGTYICVITDAVGLTASQTFNITEPAAIQGAGVVTNATNSQANGAISLTTSGGTGNLVITWSNGATGTSISSLSPGSYTANAVDANGCQKTFGPFVVESISAVADPSFVSEMKVYPNPTSSTLIMDLSTSVLINAEVVIVNNVGQQVWSKNINGSNFSERIDVSNIASGIYTIQVKNADGVANRRFIVTK
jgi:thiol-disulfide isomerase/thioredoxin